VPRDAPRTYPATTVAGGYRPEAEKQSPEAGLAAGSPGAAHSQDIVVLKV
jgi:hypothetical protein